jgi:hypothetical protein
MRTWKVLLAIGVAVAGVVAAPAMSAQASTVFCNGTFTGTTNGAVIVPSGGACYMDWATVKGSVTVFPNAVLETCHAYIGGNVQSSQDYLNIGGFTSIQGNVVVNRPGLENVYGRICATNGVTPNVQVDLAGIICPAYIGGNVTVSNAPDNGDSVDVCDAHIVGNVQILNNQEDVFVSFNHIDGSLTCIHNFYAYDVANVVKGWDVGCLTETP